ncbi:MAG TPA: ribosome maturation factor RimP [Porticoccaceae bacterium]|nr:ribosome maturation factor RimP [Porticoccaceae bacterium]
MSRDAKLTALIEPVVQSFGCELWGVEFSAAGRRGLLRVYIDKEGGIEIGDCEKVSRQLDSMLDVENPILGEYTLEVSSPGLDRPLYDLEQFRRFVGHEVSVKLRKAFEGRRKYQGALTAIEDDEIVMVSGEHEYVFPFADIERANLVPRFHGNA